jgi:hypothetical protein
MDEILSKHISKVTLIDILTLMADSKSTEATLTLDGFSVKITICPEEEEDNDD